MISIKIKDPLFTFRTRLVNILDFNPKKLSIQKVCAINDEIEVFTMLNMMKILFI